ncbi:MAG: UpxY family transcription antiterminator [Ignavibacteriaceae bacterium]|nr:UpxY family transcription antiterminator [Ignavibacteriaceae bacterium]
MPYSSRRLWYALYTKPRNEFKAAEQLSANRIEYYLPTIEKVKRWSDRRKKVLEPILRSYIFIHATEEERLISVEQKSVVKCLFEQGKPAIIPAWQIENLKKMLVVKSDFYIKEGLLPGVRIKIKSGPFQGVKGIIVESERGKALAVSIEILNRTVLTHISEDIKVEIAKDIQS